MQTVSRAYEELIRRGLISGEIGRGSFVQTQRREPEPPYLPERLGEVIDLSILKPVCEPMHLDKLQAKRLAGSATTCRRVRRFRSGQMSSFRGIAPSPSSG